MDLVRKKVRRKVYNYIYIFLENVCHFVYMFKYTIPMEIVLPEIDNSFTKHLAQVKQIIRDNITTLSS